MQDKDLKWILTNLKEIQNQLDNSEAYHLYDDELLTDIINRLNETFYGIYKETNHVTNNRTSK